MDAHHRQLEREMRLGAGYSSARSRLGLPGRNHIRNNDIQKLPRSKTACPPLFVLVELTSTILKATPPGQPPNLPPNIVALPMYKHKKAYVDVQRVPNPTRPSMTVQLNQLPLRPANALTTYAAQGTQFPAFVIHETNRSEFYTQVSRAKCGV